MGWYLLEGDEHLNLSEELREKVKQTRLKSRSKHKSYDEDEYEWAVYWCECFGPNLDEDALYGHSFVSLAQRWRPRPQSCWSVPITGPHTAEPTEDYPLGYQYWNSLAEFLESVGCSREQD